MVGTRKVLWKFLFLAVLGPFFGCATPQPPVEMRGGVPPDELAYFSDTFDELRKDLWDPAGIVHRREQFENFRSADIAIDKGELVIRTRVGSFSKGGLVSNFALRGDYDVQIDCRFDFQEDVGDADQLMGIAAMEEGPAGQQHRIIVTMNLIKVFGKRSGIFVAYRESGKIHDQSWHPTGDFRGSFRIVRTGSKIFTFYRKGDGGWHRTDVFSSISGDTRFGLAVLNFTVDRKSIQVTQPVIGRFDNFTINGAQEVIEPEI
jgi:hypothetical protein